MAFQLASAFVRISSKGLGALSFAFGKVRSMFSGVLDFMNSAIGRAGALMGGISIGAAVKLAGDAEEIQQKFEVVFGSVRQSADKWANDFARTIGRSVNTTKEQMSSIQGNLLALGFGTGEAAEMTKDLHRAAVDLASFSNKSDAQAINAVVGAIQNEREAMKSLDIVITENAVKAEVARQGNEKLTGALMEQARARATLTLIQRKGNAAMGDAERTAGSFVNRMKGLAGTIKDVAADVGRAFIPALAKMAKIATDALRRIQPRVRELAQNFGTWGRVMIENWQLTWDIIKQVASIGVSFLKDVFTSLPEVWAFHQGRMLKIAIESGPKIGKALWEGIKSAVPFLEGSVNPGELLKGMGDAFKRGFGGEEGYAEFLKSQMSDATKLQVAELKDMTAELSRLKDRADKEVKRVANKDQKPLSMQAKLDVEVRKMTLPTGFIDILDANRKVQESLLGKDDKQVEMLAEAKAGNAIQNRVAKGVDKLVALQSRIGGPARIPVADA